MAEKHILFLCFANTCRSPMAEAIARTLGGGRFEIHSAGLCPAGSVAPLSLRTLERLGYETEGLASKGLTDVPLDRMDVVVSLMGPEGMAALPRHIPADRVVWSIRDPYGEDEEAYFSVAGALEDRIRDLLTEIERAAPAIF